MSTTILAIIVYSRRRKSKSIKDDSIGNREKSEFDRIEKANLANYIDFYI